MASLLRPSGAMLGHMSRLSATQSKATPFAMALVRQTQMKSATSQTTSFHSSARKEILKPLPQVVQGSMNDAAPIPHSSPSHGSYHWTFERLIAASLVPLTIAPFAAGTLNPVMDSVLATALVLHSHIGFQALIVDYLPASRVPKTRSLFVWGLRAATLTVAVGLYEFETNDVGITEAIKRIWTA
ncbi:putative succinate dehydrogenase subunit CybS [Talaromyces proteolyticus]|uniref:Succinate dehydrogenase [ubiquinone] cytochrome b small subunit n=1 Tax=Talaromyces proteolyticus TaxID=1131652 RepID=A0AAD4KV59_9EURO|nr:putative succinate dehydrogenase subunit CybS [Talaromyces proteolyticus]KAH8699024.1 putative succinate dehydrogenase subunit CybS [Talaromyces proteolyticus]